MRLGDSGSAPSAALQVRQAPPVCSEPTDRLDCDKAGQPEPTHTDILTEGSLSAATAELHQTINKSVNPPRMRT